MRKERLTVDDIKGVWAIMPTPSTADASDWRADQTVDLDETARAIEGLIAAGVDGIISLGTFGECATLSWDEKRRFMATAVETVRGRVPFFGGTTSLNTRETIRQTREAIGLGVDGTMLGVPMWCMTDVPTAVQFYKDVAQAVPEAALCIYANNEAFKFEFPSSFWAQVSEIPQVIMSKTIGVGQLGADLRATRRRIRIMPNDPNYYAAARIDPQFCNAFWTSGAVCGPAPVIRLRDEVAMAVRTGNWERAHSLSESIAATYATLRPNGSFKDFSTYNIGLEKARMDAAEWMKAGPCRPPYHLVPAPYLEGARECGRRWADLHRRLSNEA
jgi:trans-o-hydroxybenzylidenepyruvate hydratase-aldolase